ncbi:MAG: DNA internalization-related competence protein ComEC/Rec2 [Thermoanaerobacterales bacterium]|nr:DNA internalization-related competence protein ComEC/Rec2 [Thermoanaerobacterales bacterium]
MGEERAGRPLVLLVFLFAGGIVLARYLPISGGAGLWSLLVTLIVAAIAYVWGWRSNRLLLYTLFVLLGLVAARLALAAVDTPLAGWAGRNVELTGVVAAEPDWRPDRTLYVLEARQVGPSGGRAEDTRGRVLLSVEGDAGGVAYGDLVRVRGRLVLPQDAGNPGAFDYRAYLERQGIGLLLVAKGDALTRLEPGYGSGMVSRLLALKARLQQGLAEGLGERRAAVVAGIVFGTRGAIDEGLEEAFTATGVVHILSVSGLHVGFLAGLILFAGTALRLRPGVILIISVAGLALYTVMVGAKPAVVRAGVMAVMLLFAHQLGRKYDWPTALAGAALIILLANPLALYDPGFQLSFAATWGILYIGPPVVRGLDAFAGRRGLAWRPGWGWFVGVPLGAQLATLPLVAYYYNLCSPVGLVANLVAVPLVGAIFPLGLLTSVIGAVLPHMAWLTGLATGALTDLFLRLVGFFAAVPGGSLPVPTPHPVLIALWFALWYAAALPAGDGGLRRRLAGALRGVGGVRRWAPWAVLALAGLALYLLPLERARPLEVHFIDVGQGDAALVRAPGGEEILVDAGGWPGELAGERGAGERVVVPYLKRLGIRRLDMLILSHGHEDHSGGARAVLASMPVKTLVLPPYPPEDELARLAAFASGRGVRVQQAAAGDRVGLDRGTRLDFLGPVLPLLPGPDGDPNNNSLVMRLTYGERVFLFTGDVEQEGQARLIVSGADLRADVLKVPHHGSQAYVPAFFEKVRPAAAVILVGRANRYGLPHPETVSRLQRLGARIYRTDRDGAVIITSDGRSLSVRTGRNRQARDAA